MDDLISRKETFRDITTGLCSDITCAECPFAVGDICLVGKWLCQLPTVAIPSSEPCEDAISRQAVLEKAVYTETEEGWGGYTIDIDYIKSLPSIKPQEPKTGHWILDDSDNSITCDKCGCLIYANDIIHGEAHYCPMCGADMRGDTDEDSD